MCYACICIVDVTPFLFCNFSFQHLIVIIKCCFSAFDGASFFTHTSVRAAGRYVLCPLERYCLWDAAPVDAQMLIKADDAKSSVSTWNQLAECRFIRGFRTDCFHREWYFFNKN